MNILRRAGRAVTVILLLVAIGAIVEGTMAAEKSDSPGKDHKRADQKGHNFPDSAFEYAKLVEPILGVPPKIDLGAGVEVPIYVDGVQSWGSHGMNCDNPSRLGKGGVSGSVLERYEGRTADGEPLSDVVWVSFGRNSSFEYGGTKRVFGSVQMIGYHKKSGATAFFESSDRIAPWATLEPETDRLLGEMPWIDDPEEFNKAFRTPRMIQCVECHQNDPFIHNDFIDAAKMPGTKSTVVPKNDEDSPYYVIGGETWDMRTIHIEGNGCVDCHRIGLSTLKLFEQYEWDPNEHMPPRDPGSLAEDLQELLDAWENGPENTPDAEWIIPPARGEEYKVVGADYPFKAAFNSPDHKDFNIPGKGMGKKSSKKNQSKKPDNKGESDPTFGKSREELIENMKAKGMTKTEIAEWLDDAFGDRDKNKPSKESLK